MVCAMAPDPGNAMIAQSTMMAAQLTNAQNQAIAVKDNINDNQISSREIANENINHKQTHVKDLKEETQRRVERRFDKIEKFMKAMQAINKTFKVIALFYPLIVIMTGIIIIATNSLLYVLMAIAWLGIAVLRVIYALVTLPPFIYITFYVFWILTVFMPFVAYTVVFLVVLVVLFFVCLFLSFVNTFVNLNKLLLCQNSPGIWYHTPSYQLRNQFERGIFCSKPCAKGYHPDTTGQFCAKLPKGQPDFCPKATIMRIFTGIGRKDKNHVYSDFNMKGNLRFLQKPPAEREAALFDYFINQQKFQSGCDNKLEPRYGFDNYNSLLSSVCSALDGAEKEKLQGLSPLDVKRLKSACNKAFCGSKTAYPFCVPFADSNSSDLADLIKNIILTIVAVMTFVFCMLFITYHAVAH